MNQSRQRYYVSSNEHYYCSLESISVSALGNVVYFFILYCNDIKWLNLDSNIWFPSFQASAFSRNYSMMLTESGTSQDFEFEDEDDDEEDDVTDGMLIILFIPVT